MSQHFLLCLFRAIFCKCCGMGASHLLLLQRDCHGVQLLGEGIQVILVKTYNLLSIRSVRSVHLLKGLRWNVLLKNNPELLFEFVYRLFLSTDLEFFYLFVSNKTGVRARLTPVLPWEARVVVVISEVFCFYQSWRPFENKSLSSKAFKKRALC